MLICGIKATHDGGVALIENGHLVTSVEVEKLDNRERYSSLGDVGVIARVLADEGVMTNDVDAFVVDGWWAQPGQDPEAPEVSLADGEHVLRLPVANYLDTTGTRAPIHRHVFATHRFGRATGHSSYFHASGHLLGAYCSSPFAAEQEPALVLVWDGGMTPRLYDVEPFTRTVRLASSLFPLPGSYFADFSSFFGPFYRDTSRLDSEQKVKHHLSVAGKAMAYAALGSTHPDTFSIFDSLIDDFASITPDNAFAMGKKVQANREELFPGLTDADIISSFQDYIGDLLVEELASYVRKRYPSGAPRLVIGGGCALNIKWNSRLRATGLFADVWVPPFPNDAGAAIGTACCEMWSRGAHTMLDWSVYRGPRIVVGELPAGWSAQPCDERRVARLLHEEGEPVVVLDGRAELGPRALGNRSILAPAVDPGMKDLLNNLKHRSAYRPVAPICLADRSAEVFSPGGQDPFMLFEHRPRGAWAERLPAIVHLDGTARLQTLGRGEPVATARILDAYEHLSGIPVLCNTSANLNGNGFFPDVASAARWGRTTYIWSNGILYTNPVRLQQS